MAWFSRKPDPQSSLREFRDLLFGDAPLPAWTGDGTTEPWKRFADAAARLAQKDASGAKSALASITTMPGLESRHYLQAWHALRALGESPPPDLAKRLYGVIIEVALPNGIDVLAAYEDHTLRYLNASGSAAIWEHPDATLDPQIDALLRAGREIVIRIGPWSGERPGPPPKGNARINLLTPSGHHLGEGDLRVLGGDAMAGPALAAGAKLVGSLAKLVSAR